MIGYQKKCYMYVFLAALVVLLLVLGQQFLSSYGRKLKGGSKRPVVEMGTKSADGVDYDWLPKELVQELNRSPKTPKQSPKTSPRQRRSKRYAGSGSDD